MTIVRISIWLTGSAVALVLGIAIYQTALSVMPINPAVPVATIPAVAPAGIPPVIGEGVLAIVAPHANQAVLPVTADFAGGWRGTVLVPADRTMSLAVRVQGFDVTSLDLPDGAPGLVPALGLTVQVFDAESGRLIDPFPSPLAFGLRPPTPADLSSFVAFRLDDRAVAQQPMTAEIDRQAATVTLQLDRSSRIALGRGLTGASMIPPAAPVAPASAPTANASVVAIETVRDPLPDRAPLPVRLRIASIGIDAPIVPVGLEPDGVMAATDEAHVVGWYELGARPGEVANSVLTGHVDWKQQTAVFFRLRETKPGDTIEVVSGFGRLYRYKIESLQSYRADQAPVAEVFGPSSAPILTLITCDGPFDHERREYQDRLVIRARGV